MGFAIAVVFESVTLGRNALRTGRVHMHWNGFLRLCHGLLVFGGFVFSVALQKDHDMWDNSLVQVYVITLISLLNLIEFSLLRDLNDDYKKIADRALQEHDAD